MLEPDAGFALLCCCITSSWEGRRFPQLRGLCPPAPTSHSSSVPSCPANWHILGSQRLLLPDSAHARGWVTAGSLPSLHSPVPSLRGYCGRVMGELMSSVTAYASSPLESRDKRAEGREILLHLSLHPEDGRWRLVLGRSCKDLLPKSAFSLLSS